MQPTGPSPARSSRGPARRGPAGRAELIVVAALTALVGGVAVPVVRTLTGRAERAAALESAGALARGAEQFFRDAWRLPASPDELVRDPGAPGWSGPYADPSHLRDPWGARFAFSARGDELTVASPGPDGVLGAGDDIALLADVRPVRRERTLDVLTAVNCAVQEHNLAWLGRDPLAPPWADALAKLVDRGFLSDDPAWIADGWGDELVCDPPDGVPVVRVASRRLGL